MAFKKFLKIFSIVSIILISLFLLFCSYVFLAMNGGLSGYLKSLKPEPDWNNAEITQARNKTINSINSFYTNIEEQVNFVSRGHSNYDFCFKGDHSWKRNDPYAYICNYQITKFYSFNGDFKEKLLELDSVFTKENWTNSSMTISKMISDYYDKKQNTYYGKTGLVSDLPSVQLYNRWAVLSIDYAQRETTNLWQMEYHLSDSVYNQVYSNSTQVNFQEIFQEATQKDKYFLTLAITSQYFME